MNDKQKAKQEALEQLRGWMPKGSTVYTILRHVSKSGMQREIGLVVFDDHAFHPNYSASIALGMRQGKDSGLIVNGCGMDMGFDIVSRLAEELYGDYMALKQEWL